jgi:hypothetical protein
MCLNKQMDMIAFTTKFNEFTSPFLAKFSQYDFESLQHPKMNAAAAVLRR